MAQLLRVAGPCPRERFRQLAEGSVGESEKVGRGEADRHADCDCCRRHAAIRCTAAYNRYSNARIWRGPRPFDREPGGASSPFSAW